MNRIQQLAEANESAAAAPLQLEHSLLRTAQRRGTQYCLFAPLHYEQNYAYPLLVWLHGPGDDERQLQRIMPLISMRNYVAVAPRGTCGADGGRPGFSWIQTSRGISLAEQRVFESIEAARERFHVAPRRIFLAGFQTGGTMAFRIALKNPEAFAGVLSVGGPFPTGHAPLAHVKYARHLPLFIAQGRHSTLYPVERTCEELRLFHVAGMHVTVRQYPCGDELDTQMLHDMDLWVMEQVTGSGMSPGSDHPRPSETN